MIKFGRIPLAAFCFIFIFMGPAWAIELGEPLPDFSIRTFDGEDISPSEMKGKPALVVFWNTWCAVCMKELPRINRLSEAYGSQGLKILAINTAINDSEKKARAYIKKQGFGFPFAFDDYFDIGQAFRVRGVPTIFLIDARGMVHAKFSQLPEDLEKKIKQLLGNTS